MGDKEEEDLPVAVSMSINLRYLEYEAGCAKDELAYRKQCLQALPDAKWDTTRQKVQKLENSIHILKEMIHEFKANWDLKVKHQETTEDGQRNDIEKSDSQMTTPGLPEDLEVRVKCLEKDARIAERDSKYIIKKLDGEAESETEQKEIDEAENEEEEDVETSVKTLKAEIADSVAEDGDECSHQVVSDHSRHGSRSRSRLSSRRRFRHRSRHRSRHSSRHSSRESIRHRTRHSDRRRTRPPRARRPRRAETQAQAQKQPQRRQVQIVYELSDDGLSDEDAPRRKAERKAQWEPQQEAQRPPPSPQPPPQPAGPQYLSTEQLQAMIEERAQLLAQQVVQQQMAEYFQQEARRREAQQQYIAHLQRLNVLAMQMLHQEQMMRVACSRGRSEPDVRSPSHHCAPRASASHPGAARAPRGQSSYFQTADAWSPTHNARAARRTQLQQEAVKRRRMRQQEKAPEWLSEEQQQQQQEMEMRQQMEQAHEKQKQKEHDRQMLLKLQEFDEQQQLIDQWLLQDELNRRREALRNEQDMHYQMREFQNQHIYQQDRFSHHEFVENQTEEWEGTNV